MALPSHQSNVRQGLPLTLCVSQHFHWSPVAGRIPRRILYEYSPIGDAKFKYLQLGVCVCVRVCVCVCAGRAMI
jgi:hypothetical protein